MSKKYDLIALGEVLMRLSPDFGERMSTGKTFLKYIGGAELNVVAGASNLGLDVGFMSVIPDNCIGEYAKRSIGENGVCVNNLKVDSSKDSRLGVYYYENSSSPKKPCVVYDRANSSFSKFDLDVFDEEVYSSTKCFHTSGITLGLNEKCRKNTKEIIKKFKSNGALISFDVNFRSNLWTGEEARVCIEEILPYVDIFFCSEDTARLTFGKTGDIYDIMRSFCRTYPIRYVASTQRTVISPKNHSFTSVIYDSKEDKFYTEDEYSGIEVVDRIGSGDAYVSGVLYALALGYDTEKMISYGNALSATKNTISGDVSTLTLKELEQIINDHKDVDNRVEMIR